MSGLSTAANGKVCYTRDLKICRVEWGEPMYRVSDGVRSTHGQDGAIVLDVQQGQMFNLNPVAAVKTDWGEEVVCLFEPDASAPTDATRIHYQAAEHWRVSGNPKMPTQWAPLSALSHDSLIGSSDYLAIQQSIAQCSAEGNESPSGPFARLSWLKELREWVQAVIQPLGFHLNGNVRQLNASST